MATTQQLINAIKDVYLMAHNKGYQYGPSASLPPCADGWISCDRLIARALWNLGYTDQPLGGITVMNMEEYLIRKGFKKITSPNSLRAGDIVLMTYDGGLKEWWHAFFINSFSSINNISKYDMGSQSRIYSNQPFYNIPLNEWGYRSFYCAFRLPNDIKNANQVYLNPGTYNIVLASNNNFALSFEKNGTVALKRQDVLSIEQRFDIKRHVNNKGIRDYIITAQNSGKTVMEAKKNYSLFQTEWKNMKTQLWKFSSNGDKIFMIFNASSNLPLGIQDGQLIESANVGTWNNDGLSAQEWKLIKI